MTTPDDPISDWTAYLTRRNRSAGTIRAYRTTMAAYVAVVGDPFAATLDDVDRWWDGVTDKLAIRSQQRALSCVRSFYQWAVRFDLVVKDPTRRLDPPFLGQRLPTPLGRQDLHQILDGAPGDLRRAIALGAYGGLRVAEVASLDWSHIDLETRRATIHGKGDKQRPVGLGSLLMDELLPNVGGNVVTGGGTPFSPGTLQRRVNRYIASKGVDGTFHHLRARYVTVALANGAPLLSVSRAVGHASPTTTAIYALTADSDLDLIAEAVSR